MNTGCDATHWAGMQFSKKMGYAQDAKEEAVCEEEEGEDGHDTVLLVTSDKSTPEKSDVPSR